MALRSIATAVVLSLAAVACGPSAKSPEAPKGPPTFHGLAACQPGPFSKTLSRVMPSIGPAPIVDMFASQIVDASIEPGCMLPFHQKPGDRATLDVGRVVVRFVDLNEPSSKLQLVGRGPLRVGVNTFELKAMNDAGDTTLALTIDGHHVISKGNIPGTTPFAFEGDVDANASEALPLPFDAMIASLQGCASDTRIEASIDANAIHAKRNGMELFRSRWLDEAGQFAIDTSFACSADDARFAWRTSEGAVERMLSIASSRARFGLVVELQGAANTEDVIDPTVVGMAR